jgi:outer membrane beta-barrel protein
MRTYLFIAFLLIQTSLEFLSAQDIFSYENLKKEEPVEVQVIRPRFFSKINRFELGAETIFIANQTFVNTYMMAGILSYHLNDYFGFEFNYERGFSTSKEEKNILVNDFGIKTEIDRIQSMALIGASITPIYGKYQLGNGRLLYFDTFLTVGGGATGVDYQYDHCDVSTSYAVRSPRVVQYPTAFVGFGQRYFIGNSGSFRYDIRTHFFNKDTADGACDVNTAASDSSISQTVTMQIGYSYYF